MAKHALPLGIDIGGSGIKGAPVDLDKGAFAAKRMRIDTPAGPRPRRSPRSSTQIVDHFADVTRRLPHRRHRPRGRHRTASSARPPTSTSRGSTSTPRRCSRSELGRAVTVVNDADAAGVARAALRRRHGTRRASVIITTLGTGIGSALIYRRRPLPNSELGHLEIDGYDAETRAPRPASRTSEGLTCDEWAERLQRYYSHVEALLWPDLFVVGGGVSKEADQFLPLLHLRAPIVRGPAAEHGRHHRRGPARRGRRPRTSGSGRGRSAGRAPGGR